MSEAIKLELSQQPDGFGFIYGQLHRGGEHYIVNILPPEPKWWGDMKLEGYEPDPENYIIYLDGEEVARVREIEAIRDELARLLPGG